MIIALLVINSRDFRQQAYIDDELARDSMVKNLPRASHVRLKSVGDLT